MEKPTWDQIYSDLAIKFVEFIRDGSAHRCGALHNAAIAYHHRTIADKQMADSMKLLGEAKSG